MTTIVTPIKKTPQSITISNVSTPNSPITPMTTPASPPISALRRHIEVTPIYIPPPPAPKRRVVPPTPPIKMLQPHNLLKPRTKRPARHRRQNSITEALRSKRIRCSSETLSTLRSHASTHSWPGQNDSKQPHKKQRSLTDLPSSKQRMIVRKSSGGGMGITITPPVGDLMSDRELHSQSRRMRNAMKSGRKRHSLPSDPKLLMPPSTRSIKKRVSKMNITTYSVLFNAKVLGLEMHPFDSKQGTGAVVTWCHNKFASDNVFTHSMVIGVNDQLVMDMDHEEILQLIRNSERPLSLTFHSRIYRNEEGLESESLSTWRGLDGTIRFTIN